MACSTSQQTFLNNWLNCAKSVSYQTQLPVNFVLAQWGLETGWGTGGGLCGSCNNPGNLLVSGQPACSCSSTVSSFSTKASGISMYVQKLNTVYHYLYDAYYSTGNMPDLELAKAAGAGCFPGSATSAAIYAESRYNGVVCPSSPNEEVENNCYRTTTKTNSGIAYSGCAPTITAKACADCSTGCGYMGCNLWETMTTDCLSPYAYVQSTSVTCS